MEIYLIRHSTPDIAKGICYGQSDLGVANSFEEELACLRKKIPENFDYVYSSPLQRCSILAHRISENPVFDKDLMELKFGDWELKPWNEIPRNESDHWAQNCETVAPPGGETFNEMFRRACNFWERLISNDSETVAVVSHAGVIRCLLAKLLEIPLNKTFRIGLNYTSLTEIYKNEDYISIKYINQ